MKKLLIAAALALGLAGCVTVADVNTAATRNTLYGLVNSYGVALAAENTYKALCAQGAADTHCRANVAKMQAADARAIKAIAATNEFIKKYPTVSAANLISAAQQAVVDFKSIAGAQ